MPAQPDRGVRKKLAKWVTEYPLFTVGYVAAILVIIVPVFVPASIGQGFDTSILQSPNWRVSQVDARGSRIADRGRFRAVVTLTGMWPDENSH